MKKITIILILFCSTSLSAQFSFNTTSGSGIESPTNTASGNSSVAMGENSVASGLYSLSFGVQTNASGYAAIAMGRASTASGESSTSIGHQTTASGNFSIAMGENSTASELYSMSFGVQTDANAYAALAMGRGTSASGNSSVSLNYLTSASGFYSTAMGESTTASGYVSLALGKNTTSSAEQSIAAGYGTTASGDRATSLGLNTTASGTSSTAMGLHTVSESPSSLVIGSWNELNEGDEWPLFVIGNGGWDATATNYLGGEENRSNAFEVLFDGTTTIAGSVTASSFIGDGSGLTSLPLVVESITEGGNTGVRLSSSNAANHGDIGNTAVDLSYQGSASSTTGATGQSSFAVGLDSTASGTSSISGGYLTIASGDASVALGNGAQATGTYSYSIGHLSKANGDNSVALGTFNESDGQWATSMGIYTNAVGDASTSIGHQTDAKDYASLVLGQYNLLGSTVTNSSTSFSSENTALVIGNGADGNNRSDALVVKFDGTTTIAGDLSINSDARLKANIVSLGSTLAKLLQIDGKSYTMKKDESEKQKIGLLAQDIEKVFPELVSESNGIKSVNYQGLVPVLINAMKEQQRILSEQQSELDELKSMMKKIIEKQ